MKIYVDLQFHQDAKRWLEEILRSLLLRTESLEKQDAVELLYIGLICGMEDKVLSFLPQVTGAPDRDVTPELKAFEVFYHALRNGRDAAQAIQELSRLRKEASLTNPHLKNKAFDQMVRRVRQAAAANNVEDRPIDACKPHSPATNKSKPQPPSARRQYRSVIRLADGGLICPYDLCSLKSVDALLAQYADAKKTQVSRYLLCSSSAVRGAAELI